MGGIYLLVGTIIASSLMDKQGRKSLLITSFSGMVMPLCSTIRVFIFSQSANGGFFTYSLFSLEGCFNATPSIVLHLESSGTLFWYSCRCWHCSVSCQWFILFGLILFECITWMFDITGYDFVQVCAVLCSRSGSCSSPTSSWNICLQNKGQGSRIISRHALGESWLFIHTLIYQMYIIVPSPNRSHSFLIHCIIPCFVFHYVICHT